MKYLQRSFTVKMGENEAYRSNYDRIFAKKPVLSDSLTNLSEPLSEKSEVGSSESSPTNTKSNVARNLKAVLLHLPREDYQILSAWAADKTASTPLDPDVAHTVLMAVVDAVTSP